MLTSLQEVGESNSLKSFQGVVQTRCHLPTTYNQDNDHMTISVKQDRKKIKIDKSQAVHPFPTTSLKITHNQLKSNENVWVAPSITEQRARQ